MREVRIYPSNLIRTYKWGGGGGRGKGGVKIAWGEVLVKSTLRGGTVAFPRVGSFSRALEFCSLYYP